MAEGRIIGSVIGQHILSLMAMVFLPSKYF